MTSAYALMHRHSQADREDMPMRRLQNGLQRALVTQIDQDQLHHFAITTNYNEKHGKDILRR